LDLIDLKQQLFKDGASDDFEAFVDGKKGHIKMGDLVPADPNQLKMDEGKSHNLGAGTLAYWVETLINFLQAMGIS